MKHTDWDRHYIKGTLRTTKLEEEDYPECDWYWYLLGGIFSGVAFVYTLMWLMGY
jgi:hypothetical protein